ncbi:MAG TPA: phosphatase PAP2 family protein [Candidatus Nanoarchaeia archaeon]|nr:phosphatase PAP2 family protein [Candidatus Nanoarchaeia archaeon]
MRKYKDLLKTEVREFFRDFSGLGNILILTAIYSLVFEGRLFVLAIGGLAITLLICYSIKVVFHRNRPLQMGFTNMLEKIQSGSFPSVHSAEIMYSGLSVIFYINNVIVDAVSVMIILIVGYSRYHLKQHYTRDIIGGYFIGFAVFYLVFLS